jgi:hypothetical protein
MTTLTSGWVSRTAEKEGQRDDDDAILQVYLFNKQTERSYQFGLSDGVHYTAAITDKKNAPAALIIATGAFKTYSVIRIKSWSCKPNKWLASELCVNCSPLTVMQCSSG